MNRASSIVLLALSTLLAAHRAHAVKVGDITRLSGQQSNILTGMGLVVGLPGTGDGGDYLPAIRPLAAMLSKLNNNADARELTDVANVALVTVSAVVPPRGVARGDTIDVYVTSVGPATSLKGGRLFVPPMVGPTGGEQIYAFAQGNV